jgi:predicted transcriptional regulator of viral defense system
MNIYFKLLGIPVFSVADVDKYYNNLSSSRSALQRLLKAGMIKKIRNDMYTCVNGENGMAVANRFQIGSHINDGAYISHHSAMEYYGITDQVFYDVYVTSEKKFNSFEFEGYRYHRVAPAVSVGVRKEEYSGGVIVTDRERTILDSIKDMEKISGMEEVISNIESVGKLREKKMLAYLEEYDNQFLYQKVGLLLENDRERYGLSEHFFEICKGKIGNSKRYLTDKNADGVYSLKWKVIVPKNIFNLKNGDLPDADI